MLNCIGTGPDGSGDYICSNCKGVFEIKQYDETFELVYEEPKFCPSCGKGPVGNPAPNQPQVGLVGLASQS